LTLKNTIPVFQNFSPALANNQMTGTQAITSPPTEISLKDNIAYELTWTGTPVGTFAVQVSIDYNPGNTQSKGGYDPGTWQNLPLTDTNGNPLVASGSPGQIFMNLTEICFPWIRVQYTNTSGTGVLSGWISGKSIGL
jgi:hypothetical protein